MDAIYADPTCKSSFSIHCGNEFGRPTLSTKVVETTVGTDLGWAITKATSAGAGDYIFDTVEVNKIPYTIVESDCTVKFGLRLLEVNQR